MPVSLRMEVWFQAVQSLPSAQHLAETNADHTSSLN